MLKPSERVREIMEEKELTASPMSNLDAILQYLDETWEKEQPCQHEDIEPFGGAWTCNKCHLVGNFKKDEN